MGDFSARAFRGRTPVSSGWRCPGYSNIEAMSSPLPRNCTLRSLKTQHADREGGALEAKSRIIAIFNTNPEVLELVRESLQQAGFQAVIAHIDDLKRCRPDILHFADAPTPALPLYCA